MKQKNIKELTAPAPIFVALQRMQATPSRTFRFILPDKIPAHTPKVEYDKLNINEEMRP